MTEFPICLCMIVRDEAQIIERCLRSVRPYITHWAVVDTGSEDATPEIVRSFLDELPGELVRCAWKDDFALHRNQSVSIARHVLGGGGGHLLFIDADETLTVDHLRNFQRAIRARAAVSWWAIDGDWHFRKLGIVNIEDIDRWHGSVHEYIRFRAPAITPARPQRFAHLEYGHDGYRRRSKQTCLRDISLLKGAMEQGDSYHRNSFFLACTYEASFEYATAAYYFGLAAEANNATKDDRWQALWGLGRVLQHLDQSLACKAYFDAHSIAPARAEALVALAAFARNQGQFVEARSLADAALRAKVPTATSMYDLSAYSWRAADELCFAAHALRDRLSMQRAAQSYQVIIKRGKLPTSELNRIEKNVQVLQRSV